MSGSGRKNNNDRDFKRSDSSLMFKNVDRSLVCSINKIEESERLIKNKDESENQINTNH